MAFPYSGDDMECAAVARATMVANTPNNANANNLQHPEDSHNYSTTESEAEFSINNTPSVSTTMLVGTFYDPNGAPSDTNSFVSDLQDELSNNGHPRMTAAAVGGGDGGSSNNLAAGASPTAVVSFPHFFRSSKSSPMNTSNTSKHNSNHIMSDHYGRDSFSTLDVPWKSGDLSATDDAPNNLSGRGGCFYTRRRMCFGLATCLLVTVAVAMGVIIGVNHEQGKIDSAAAFVAAAPPAAVGATMSPTTTTVEEDDTDGDGEAGGNSGSNPATNASNDDTDTTTTEIEIETASPSGTTNFDSFEPSPDALPSGITITQTINSLVSSLPSYTQQAFEIPTSPQKRALHWITSDPALLSYSSTQMKQRFALKTFYFATNGGNDEQAAGYDQQSWLQTGGWQQPAIVLEASAEGETEGQQQVQQPQQPRQHECQWFSTHEDSSIEPPCNDEGMYTVLSLRGNNLQGALPRELALLTSLEILDLELNSIQSSLPTELGLLTNLKSLIVRANDIVGEIPSELGFMSNSLVDLQLENNALIGRIPLALAYLTDLVTLTLDDNRLSGNIPSHLGYLTKLENLLVHGNLITGAVPTELGSCTQLQSLSLRNNLLTSLLPTEVGLLTNLERLWAYQNDLSGPLPTELGYVTRLSMLSLSRNQMTGSIPSELGLLTQIVNLWLYQNTFVGKLPSELGRLTSLELLPLRDNLITGVVPTEICAIPMLEVTIDCLEVVCDCGCTCGNYEGIQDGDV